MYTGKHKLKTLKEGVKKYDGRSTLAVKRMKRDNRMRSFYNNLDLPEFKEALRTSQDPKFQMLMMAIMNPRLASCSFMDLCRRCDLTINDVATLWKNHQLAQGMMRMMGHMPQVMEDVAIDSKSKEVTCPSCGGTGKSTETFNRMENAICRECHGDGKIRILGDEKSRVLLFEAAGLKKSSYNPSVNVNIGSGSLPSLEDVIKDAEKALDVVATEVENAKEETEDDPRSAA